LGGAGSDGGLEGAEDAGLDGADDAGELGELDGSLLIGSEEDSDDSGSELGGGALLVGMIVPFRYPFPTSVRGPAAK
jgi:hypothetical protein